MYFVANCNVRYISEIFSFLFKYVYCYNVNLKKKGNSNCFKSGKGILPEAVVTCPEAVDT